MFYILELEWSAAVAVELAVELGLKLLAEMVEILPLLLVE
jgi:hypothetical protein